MVPGIALGAGFPDHRPLAYGMVVAGLFSLSLLLIKYQSSLFAPCILFFGLGYLLIQPWTAPRFPDDHISRFAGDPPRIITGVVCSEPIQSGFRQKFTLRSEFLGTGAARREVTGRIRVSVSKSEKEIIAGDRVTLVGTIRPIRSFQNGGFNYRRYMALKSIWVSVSAKGRSFQVLDHPGLSGLVGRIAPARRALAAHLEAVLPKEHAGIIKALVVGDKRGVGGAQRELFQRAGMGHLLAISGLHVGIVAAASFFIFNFVFSFIPFLLFQAWTKKGAAGISIIVVLVYGLLAGMSPSTFRAVIMASVFLSAILFGRTQDTVNSLAVAALIILLVDPPALFSISFQLSFAAVTAIVLGIGTVGTIPKNTSEAVLSRIMCRVGMFTLVSLFAILGTLPLVLYYFNQTSTVGLVTNLIFIPLLGFCMVPLALLSAVLFPMSTSLSTVGLKLCSLILDLCMPWIQGFATLPFAVTRLITPSPIEIALYYGFLGIFLALLYRRRYAFLEPSREVNIEGAAPALAWSWKIVPLLTSLLVLLSTVDAFYWAHQRFWRSDLRITVIDVGHGSATLLEFPKGGTMLVDGGGFSDNTAFDVGKRVVAPVLWQKKIKTIDTVVLSHPNSDHLNGLVYILQHFKVKRLWSNHEHVDTKGYQKFRKVVRDNGIPWPWYTELKRQHFFNGVTVDLLYPPIDFLKKTETWRNSNNNSLVLKISFGMFAFLIPGDLMASGERELVAMAPPGALQCDLLLAPHHGSRTSSTVPFLQAVLPKLIIVSTGGTKLRQGMQADVRARYDALGAVVIATCSHGAITVTTDGVRMGLDATALSMERRMFNL